MNGPPDDRAEGAVAFPPPPRVLDYPVHNFGGISAQNGFSFLQTPEGKERPFPRDCLKGRIPSLGGFRVLQREPKAFPQMRGGDFFFPKGSSTFTRGGIGAEDISFPLFERDVAFRPPYATAF